MQTARPKRCCLRNVPHCSVYVLSFEQAASASLESAVDPGRDNVAIRMHRRDVVPNGGENLVLRPVVGRGDATELRAVGPARSRPEAPVARTLIPVHVRIRLWCGQHIRAIHARDGVPGVRSPNEGLKGKRVAGRSRPLNNRTAGFFYSGVVREEPEVGEQRREQHNRRDWVLDQWPDSMDDPHGLLPTNGTSPRRGSSSGRSPAGS